MRERFAAWLRQIVDKYPPATEIDVDALADNFTGIIEGAIILSKALRDTSLMGKHTRLFRQHIRLIFGA